MPSAANGKSEKPASAEATDNSPVRQIMTVIEHKIRNLEKRKSKLTSYRDLQKAGKELNADQKVAVAKYDEVAQTLEFARDLSKQVSSIAVSAERESKKQAKKEAWVRYAAETSKIRETLLIIDCLMQMGTPEVREDFLSGSNGAAKLTEEDLKVLDDLYPEVTPKHELNEEGQPGFHIHATRAAEHLYAIIDGKPKEVLGTTYTHIKEIVTSVHQCGYFDKGPDDAVPDTPPEPAAPHETASPAGGAGEAPLEVVFAAALPVPPAPAVVPAPGYPLRALPPMPPMPPMPPITLQEVEHAYFAQQYHQAPPPQRPIAEVIGSQNFFFLQDSEIDSPAATPTPAPAPSAAPEPPAPIPTQTFTNQHFVRVAPEPAALPAPPPHFPPHRDHPAYPVPQPALVAPAAAPAPAPALASAPAPAPAAPSPPVDDGEWKESESPERDEGGERKQGQGDGQNRYRRYGRGGGGGGRGASNGYRRPYQSRQNDNYHRHSNDYQDRQDRPERPERSGKDGYSRQYNDGYQGRHKDNYQRRGNDAYYGNGDSGNGHPHGDTNGRERHEGGGFKRGGRGGGAARGSGSAAGAGAPRSRPPRSFSRKPEPAE